MLLNVLDESNLKNPKAVILARQARSTLRDVYYAPTEKAKRKEVLGLIEKTGDLISDLEANFK